MYELRYISPEEISLFIDKLKLVQELNTGAGNDDAKKRADERDKE